MIAVATVALGIVGVLFFDTAFEVFHELFFPAGSFLFDPATDRLVQLFPETFWVETTIAVGVVIIVLAAGLAWFGGRRARTLEARVEGRLAASGERPPARPSGTIRPRPRRSPTAADDERRRADRPDPGIEIRVSLAWTLLIALITVIGAQQATIGAPDLNPVVQWLIGVAVALLFFVSVIAHELAHAIVGRRRGVPATSIVLGFIGGLAPLGIQAARPRDELAIAVAGPAVSLAIGVLLLLAGMLVATIVPSTAPVSGGRRRGRRAEPDPRAAEPAARPCRSTAGVRSGRSRGPGRAIATRPRERQRRSVGWSAGRSWAWGSRSCSVRS